MTNKLREAAEAFVAWNKKYPSSRIYNESEIRRIAAELDKLCEQTESALAEHSEPLAKVDGTSRDSS